MDVLSSLGGYFRKFDKPIDVSTISKLTKWPNLQTLGHDASLKDASKNFHGVVDAKVQILKYTLANPHILMPSWLAIASDVLLNGEVAKLMSSVDGLGQVGPSILAEHAIGAAFSTPASLLQSASSATQTLNLI